MRGVRKGLARYAEKNFAVLLEEGRHARLQSRGDTSIDLPGAANQLGDGMSETNRGGYLQRLFLDFGGRPNKGRVSIR